MPQLPNMIADMVGQPGQAAFSQGPGPTPKPGRGPVPYRALLLSYAQRDNWPNFIRAQYGLPPAGQDLIDPSIAKGLRPPRATPQPRSIVPPIGIAPPERPMQPQAQQPENRFPLMTALAAGKSPSEAFTMPTRPAAQPVDLPALFRSNLAS